MKGSKLLPYAALGLLVLALPAALSAGTICTCTGATGSYSCSGVWTNCPGAISNFYTYCDGPANTACGFEGVCSLDMTPPNSCTQYPSDPGNYYANGHVAYRCNVCIDYPDW